jgi:ATP-dependent Lon protease
MPSNGFLENFIAKKCVDTSAHLSSEEHKLKTEIECLFKELNFLLAKFKNENSTFELNLFASDYLADVKKQIKSKKELIKYKLDQGSTNLINEVNKFEEKFSKKVQTIHDSDVFESKRVNELKLKFENEFRSTSSENKFNNLIEIQAQLNDHVNCLRNKLNELESLKM